MNSAVGRENMENFSRPIWLLELLKRDTNAVNDPSTIN